MRRQFLALAGIDPYPGTLNLVLDDAAQRQRWRDWCATPGLRMVAEPAFCSARCYPVLFERRIPAAVVLPEIAGYPPDKLEIVAALPLRQHLSLPEGARVAVELCRSIPVKAVLFDIDGTLVDSVTAYVEMARLAARPHGFDVTEAQVRHALATGAHFWKQVVPADRDDAKALMRAMSEHAIRVWPQVLREHARLFDGLADTIETLHRQGIRLGIVSGAPPEVLELLRAAGLLDRFGAIVLGGDVSRRKPDPEGILKCLDLLGVAAADAVYVGDAAVDIQASRAAGVGAIGVLTGAADSAMMTALEPDRLLYSHAGLTAAVTLA